MDTLNMQNSDSFRINLRRDAAVYDIALNEAALDSFDKYREILSEYNLRTNLVSKGDMDRFLEYHILDSLKIASCYDMAGVRRIMDFGSGAGLPGIPLAIAFPEIETVLVESRNKRSEFLSAAVDFIPLPKTTVLSNRLETLGEDYNRSFDLVITRATFKLDKFFLSARRFITPAGSLISIKGNDIEDEIVALKKAAGAKLFNINISAPKEVLNVRSGNVVLISPK
ncbi:16S rRNA (guanine(527)-N(7))-methyltransferase RsmG [Candidatus Latescibacterota bacterium]